MKRYLIIASFVFMQIYAQFLVYEPRHGIDKLDAMGFAPLLGFLLWMAGIGAIGLIVLFIKEMEEKQ